MATWHYAIATNGGLVLEWLQPQRFAITRRISGHLDTELSFPAERATRFANTHNRSIMAWRDGVLRFFGRIGPPLTDTDERLVIRAYCPYWWLGNRPIRESGIGGDPTYKGVVSGDVGDVAWGIIDDLNSYSDVQGTFFGTRLRQGASPVTVTRTFDIRHRQKANSIISELADRGDGFWFRIDPVDGVADVQADFVVLYPNPGVDRPKAIFEYGDGTLDNVEHYERVETPPVHGRVYQDPIVGAEGGGYVFPNAGDDFNDMAHDVPLSVLTSADRADWELPLFFKEPRFAYSITPRPGGPMLWDDFDVGDTARLRIRHFRVDANVSPRVNEATVTVDEENVETLSSLVLEV